MTPLRRALADVRAAATIAPVRPAWGAGLRAAIATVVPLAVAQALGLSGGTWLSLAGFTGALSDKGGPYRSRAIAIGALATAGAVTVALGTLAGTRLAIAVPLTFVVAVACSLARIWGDVGATVGASVLNIFVIALAFREPSLHEALTRSGWVLLGGLWAMLVALVLWPLRPYRPVRLAVAAAYRALSEYVAEVAVLMRPDSTGGTGGIPSGRDVRLALEAARSVLAATRRGRSGASERGERLLLLREMVDQLFGHVVALAETIDAIPPERRDSAAQTALSEALDAVAAATRAMADAVEEERGSPTVAITWSGAAVKAASSSADALARDAFAHAAILLDRLAQYSGVAAAIVATLNVGGPIPAVAQRIELSEPEPSVSPIARLRAVFAPDSVVLRYGLRLALVTAAAVWLTSALNLQRGYWVTITVVLILQPYTGVTSMRALQRVLGTVLGGVLTAALGALFHDPLAILPLVFVVAAVSVALLPLNYAAFSVFLTPTFVLLAEANTGDWHLAGIRIVDTLLGGGLALLGARVLWPSPESVRLPSHLGAALRANREYLRRVAELFGETSEGASQRLRAARREADLTAVNAEESFERWLAEQHEPGDEVAAMMTFLAFIRRVTASTAALSVTRFAPDAPPMEALAPFASRAMAVLDELAAAVAERRCPQPLPTVEESDALTATLPPLVGARLQRLARQLRSLHDAAGRWLEPKHSATAHRAPVT